MGKGITGEGEQQQERLSFWPAIQAQIRETIQMILEQELAAALGIERYGRDGAQRKGYRNGTRERTLGGPTGAVKLKVPRGLLFDPQGGEKEWNSRVLPRYERRLPEVNEAIVGAYLSGANSRKLKGVLAPLLKGSGLSRSTVSRMVCKLKHQFAQWRQADLSALRVKYVYLDGFFMRVRRDGKVVSAPVLAAVGVLVGGEKRLLALDMSGSESFEAWRNFVEDLARRGLDTPQLCIIDGSVGLRRALELIWPAAAVQRCTVHKLRNLLAKAPQHSHPELTRDYNHIIHAATLRKARLAWHAFTAKWRSRCPAVVASLEEGGDELLTFYRFPTTQWRSLRTTNVIERLNEEFRRRVKTQGALPGEEAALVLLFALIISGQIILRRIDGFADLSLTPATSGKAAA